MKVDETLKGDASPFALAHAVPSYDLAMEPWIGVQYTNGTSRDIGLRQLLQDAHLIADITEGNPLVRAALRRYLIAIVVATIRLSANKGPRAWQDRIKAREGFTELEIDALIANQREHLWLFHPRTPFMQDIRLIDEPGTKAVNVNDLAPHIPAGDSETAWFIKPTDTLMSMGLVEADAARFLLTRRFYVLAGNSGNGVVGSPYVSAGATAPLTQVFRIDRGRGLFASLLRNITSSLIAPGPTGGPSGLAWMVPGDARPLGDGLYEYTLATSSALLGQNDPAAGGIHKALRGTVGVKDKHTKELLVAARDAAKLADPHIFWVPNKADKPGGVERKMVRIKPRSDSIDVLLGLKRNPEACFGVAALATLWIDSRSASEIVEFLLASVTGSALSFKWADVVISSVPLAYFDSTSDRAEEVTWAVESVITPIERDIWFACAKAFTRSDRQEKALSASGNTRALADWRTSAAEAIAGILVNDDAIDEVAMKHSLSLAARTSVERALAPYAASAAWAPSIIQAIEGMHIYSKGVSV